MPRRLESASHRFSFLLLHILPVLTLLGTAGSLSSSPPPPPSERLAAVERRLSLLYPEETFKSRAQACDRRLDPGRTYGEFTEFPEGLRFFYEVVERCRRLRLESMRLNVGKEVDDEGSGLTFVDLGSGAGRAVLSAASLWEWQHCAGIEVSAPLHDLALAAASRLVATPSTPLDDTSSSSSSSSSSHLYSCSPVAFHCSAFEDAAAQELLSGRGIRTATPTPTATLSSDDDGRSTGSSSSSSSGIVAFAFSTAFPTDPRDGSLSWLAESLRCLPGGSIVATVDHPLVAQSRSPPPPPPPRCGDHGSDHGRYHGRHDGGLLFLARGELTGAGSYGAPGLDARAFLYERSAVL